MKKFELITNYDIINDRYYKEKISYIDLSRIVEIKIYPYSYISDNLNLSLYTVVMDCGFRYTIKRDNLARVLKKLNKNIDPEVFIAELEEMESGLNERKD